MQKESLLEARPPFRSVLLAAASLKSWDHRRARIEGYDLDALQRFSGINFHDFGILLCEDEVPPGSDGKTHDPEWDRNSKILPESR